MSADTRPFWETTPLSAMSETQWESLCDGCGRCCLIKLEDEDTGRYYFTDVVCALFDGETCTCQDYPNRQTRVPDCVKLTPNVIGELGWMPSTCAYRLLAEGQGLPHWHPLVSGRRESVIEAGVSVKDRIFAREDELSLDEIVLRVKAWPGRWPRGSRPPDMPRRRNPRN